MEQAFFISLSLLGTLGGITSYAIYTAFGSGAKELTDPFLEHED